MFQQHNLEVEDFKTYGTTLLLHQSFVSLGLQYVIVLLECNMVIGNVEVSVSEYK